MNGIEIDGLDELTELVETMTITESDERKAMRKAIEPVAEKLKAETPKGNTKKLSDIKISIIREEFAVVGKVKLGAWWDIFQEFGTSKSKKNVGFFERSINKTQNEAIEILKKELLDKIS